MPHSSPASHRGRLVVVSGPSGVGKSSILGAVLGDTNSVFSVSATTRAPRPGEQDGREYHFLTRPDFEERVGRGDVLEWAEYGGQLYGTLRSEVEPVLDRGVDCVLDIENEGAKQIRASFPEAVLIFIRPPSIGDLERRLRGRGDTSEDDIDRRLAVAQRQIDEAPTIYDHIVVNDDLPVAISRILDILTSLAGGRPSFVVPEEGEAGTDVRHPPDDQR